MLPNVWIASTVEAVACQPAAEGYDPPLPQGQSSGPVSVATLCAVGRRPASITTPAEAVGIGRSGLSLEFAARRRVSLAAI